LVEIVEMIERIGIVIPKEMQPAFLKTCGKLSLKLLYLRK
jgi:hypothetical protein